MKQNFALEWLKAAYSDSVVLNSIVDNDVVTHITAFHSQQLVEKTLKAILEHHKRPVPRKHDVKMLSKLVKQYIIVDNDYILDALNDLYIDSRYPGSFGLLPNGKPTLEDVKEFYDFAFDLFHHVCTLLNINLDELKE